MKTRNMGDLIKNLPTDYIPPSTDESQVLRILYDDDCKKPTDNGIVSQQKTTRTLADEITTAAILAISFGAIAGQWWDGIVARMIPSAKGSPSVILIVKSLVFMMVGYIMLNSGLLGRPASTGT